MWSPLADRPPRSVAPSSTRGSHQSDRLGGIWMPTSGMSSPARFDEVTHVIERHLGGPRRQRDRVRGVAVLLGLLCDLRRLLAVVAPVRHEVLEDHLLKVPVLGVCRRQRLERLDPVGLRLADPHQDPARERDPELAGGADRLEPERRVLGRRALVRHEVVAHRLEHQALRRGHLAQPGEVLARQRAEVRVGEDAALERALAAPGHVGHEVVEPERRQALADAGVVVGLVAGQDEQLLDPAARRVVQQPLDLIRLVEVRPVRRERAVLAVRDARSRQRQRQVAREGDAARGHAAEATGRLSP